MLLAKDSPLSEGKAVGVDFGCGAMPNRGIFRTEQYWGVELDPPTLQKGMKRYPEAHGVLSRIEDSVVPPADFALCVSVFAGTNFEKFGPHYDLKVLNAIVDRVAPGGTLIITFNPKKIGAELLGRLRSGFKSVTEIGIDLPSKPHSILAPIVAYNYLRKGAKSEKPQRVYVRCEGKLA
jgi:hypothetical protein